MGIAMIIYGENPLNYNKFRAVNFTTLGVVAFCLELRGLLIKIGRAYGVFMGKPKKVAITSEPQFSQQ